jgi:hypothetical protein
VEGNRITTRLLLSALTLLAGVSPTMVFYLSVKVKPKFFHAKTLPAGGEIQVEGI